LHSNVHPRRIPLFLYLFCKSSLVTWTTCIPDSSKRRRYRAGVGLIRPPLCTGNSTSRHFPVLPPHRHHHHPPRLSRRPLCIYPCLKTHSLVLLAIMVRVSWSSIHPHRRLTVPASRRGRDSRRHLCVRGRTSLVAFQKRPSTLLCNLLLAAAI